MLEILFIPVFSFACTLSRIVVRTLSGFLLLVCRPLGYTTSFVVTFFKIPIVLTGEKLYGVYFHDLVVHSPPSRAYTLPTESTEWLFSQIKHISSVELEHRIRRMVTP